MQDNESFGEWISLLWLMKIKNKKQVTLYLMDLVVGEIKNTYIHTGQCFLVRRHFEVGESKVQFYSSAVLVCNVYELK